MTFNIMTLQVTQSLDKDKRDIRRQFFEFYHFPHRNVEIRFHVCERRCNLE